MISICIPAYKYLKLLPETMDSILCQNEDFELIVLEDFDLIDPKDASKEIIDETRELFCADTRVKWYKNTTSLPIQDNWNKTVSLASCPYIKLMGADDKMLPGSIAKIKTMIQQQPQVQLHGHLAQIIDADSNVIRKQRPYTNNSEFVTFSNNTALKGKIRQQIRFKEPVCNFYKKTAWEAVGGYDKKYRFLTDVNFSSKLMASFPSALWNAYLAEVRRHPASDGASLSSELALRELDVFVADLIQRLGDEATAFDRSAGRGWVLYRFIELFAQRASRKPTEVFGLLGKNADLLLSSPVAYFYTVRLLRNRILYGDIQQKVSG
jgi:glycosyltransferase involved in cell wall biosynthesis